MSSTQYQKQVEFKGSAFDIDSINKKNNITTTANDDIYFYSFCDLLHNAYDNQLNWKVYIKFLHDLHELILPTNDVRKQIHLIKRAMME